MDISLISNSALRVAIQRNLVSFPPQIPALMKRPGGDMQERMAQLYFALGWTVRSLGERYGLSKAMVQKLLSEWRIRAIAAGFVQEIHPEALNALIHIKDEIDAPIPSPGETPRPVAAQLLASENGRAASQPSM